MKRDLAAQLSARGERVRAAIQAHSSTPGDGRPSYDDLASCLACVNDSARLSRDDCNIVINRLGAEVRKLRLALRREQRPRLARESGDVFRTMWDRCYACGHRLWFPATGCPQCGVDFDDRPNPKRWPNKCACDRCAEAKR